MSGFLLLLIVGMVVSFFAFREGKDNSKLPMDYNSVVFAKNRLMRDKVKNSIEKNHTSNSFETAKLRGTGEVVYASSKKYHRKECRFANKNSNPVSLETAKSQDLKPCKICNP